MPNKSKKKIVVSKIKITIIGEIDLATSKKTNLYIFLKHTLCFPYFPSFFSHVLSIRYVLIKVLLDFREL